MIGFDFPRIIEHDIYVCQFKTFHFNYNFFNKLKTLPLTLHIFNLTVTRTKKRKQNFNTVSC